MKYLLDTSVFLWLIFDQPEKLSAKVKKILNADNDFVLSAASVWEISIKYSLGKLAFQDPPHLMLPNIILEMGLIPLPISQRHALAVSNLPPHHRDPFDRLLVAQAKIEALPLLSPDKIFKKYSTDVIW